MGWSKPNKAFPDPPERLLIAGVNLRGLIGPPHEPTAAERAAEAERRAAYEAARCQECGCHPDEHGAY